MHDKAYEYAGEASQTYLIAALALFLANVNTLTATLGFVLVVVRLAYEIPRAWRSLTKDRSDD